MGHVYYGRSPGGRHVAVKVIRGDLAQDQSFRARFAREVEAARRVSGAFTAPVIDADPDAPVPWLVTDYVPGPSLGDAVARHGALPAPAVLTLAARLAEGLAAVHAAGVIHRDLKPANVLLAEDGPRLIDFGISQAADFAQITSPTSVLGTPGFIAPELIQGGPVGPASDVFTMGAVLAYAATGEYPFGTGPADARTLRVLYLAPDLDKVPAGLRPVLERCLAKDPAERPTAGEFLADLVAACPDAADDRDDWLPAGILAEIRQRPLPQETAKSGPGVAVPPPAAPAPAAPAGAGRPLRRPWTRRRRVWASTTAAAVAILGAVIGLLAAPSGHPARPALPAPTGLSILTETRTSVTLGWHAYVDGGRPNAYEIDENGNKLIAVPGSQTTYQVTGLSSNTAYQFIVVAVTGAGRSAPSATVLATTATPPAPPLGDGVFDYEGSVTSQETASSDSRWQKAGATWEDTWDVGSNCVAGDVCAAAALYGTINGIAFTAILAHSGATYTGVAAIDDYWLDCHNQGNYENTTLSVKLTVTQEEIFVNFWDISAFTGTMTWNVPALPDGCAGALYQMRVTGTS
jgi:hypothetical protein